MRFDDYYMNFAYLSEKWLADYLSRRFSSSQNSDWHEQIEDERRHTLACEAALNLKKVLPIVHDTNFSLQVGLYYKSGLIGDPEHFSEEEVRALCFLVERRALGLYRFYLRHGSDPTYKAVTKAIIKDEMGHSKIHARRTCETYQSLIASERELFSGLTATYGSEGMTSLRFWQDFFADRLELNVHAMA